LNYIGYQKLHERYPEDVKIERLAFEDERTCLEIYERYEEEKNKTFALDFDDLLLKTNYILENYKDVKRRWANRYQYILVDEFQDTNDTQYKLIKHFMTPATNLYVVGDPDQTIYTWRGANQKIIIDLSHEFPMIQTITLERNYRSTQNILDSANKLISYNRLRLKKNLYTQNNPGKPVLVRSTNSGKLEADFVAREIEKLVQVDGYSYNDIAILYRSNYITMDFESALMSKQIPYQIFGGLKFRLIPYEQGNL
jgi:DNA helicase-2/ATP-dependent DNA helicase PcrA